MKKMYRFFHNTYTIGIIAIVKKEQSIAKNYFFEWEEIIGEAREKDLWVDPLEVCKTLKFFNTQLFTKIKWIKAMNANKMDSLLNRLHDDIFFGRENSIKNKSL